MHWSVLHELLITTRFTDSLHSNKTWGRLTLIEKNRDYSDSFYYPNFFCPAPFMSINKSHLESITTFSHQTKLNPPNGKELQGVISTKKKVFSEMKIDRISSYVLTRTFMSHNL